MRLYKLLVLASVLASALSCVAVAASAQTKPSCTELTNLSLPGVEITTAVEVAAGAPIPSSYPRYTGELSAHCRVEGVIDRRKGVGGEEFGIGFAVAL
ncbi:MAG: hypothetical protein WBD91_01420, partial [Acidobacteriaceae bacterium]